MYKIQTLNKISPKGLELFPREAYEVAGDLPSPHAIIVRSYDMHKMDFQEGLLAVARAGAGTNNIPIAELTQRGVVVFNTPGANANAVKELVLLALLAASRPIMAASAWAKRELIGESGDILAVAEKHKGQFIGPELKGKVLGVVGLGAIGALVANLAVELGMKVLGFDPYLSVGTALTLDHRVKIAESMEALMAASDYITLHVPENEGTRGMINCKVIKLMKRGVRLINIARGGLVVNKDVLSAIADGVIAYMVTDFVSKDLLACDKVLCLPHLGASTPEAEDNCATMAVEQVRSFLETGMIVNSVNYPKCKIEFTPPIGGTRLCISIKNVPAIIGKITTILSGEHLNISNMINKSRGDIAYNVIDVEGKVSSKIKEAIDGIDSVIASRLIVG